MIVVAIIISLMCVALYELVYDENNEVVFFGAEAHHLACIQLLINTINKPMTGPYSFGVITDAFGKAANTQTGGGLIIAAVDPVVSDYVNNRATDEELTILQRKTGSVQDFHRINQIIDTHGPHHLPAAQRVPFFLSCQRI